jgi:glutamate synthase (NADPH/NADH) large chain
MNDYSLGQGLYDPAYDRDSCGVTLVADLQGNPSHNVVSLALEALARMEHRGALGADGKTGDGVGILTQIPDIFFRFLATERGLSLPQQGNYAVGMLFLPQSLEETRELQIACDEIITKFGFETLFWRQVATASSCLGALAKSTEPHTWQVILARSSKSSSIQNESSASLTKDLFLVRRVIEKVMERFPRSAVVSLDAQTIVYKGMMLAHDLCHYYPDLQSPAFISALAVVHARFSTNTFPSWKLAQPFRRLCHNGEINTLKGNLASLRSRTQEIADHIFGDNAEHVLPLVSPGLSDSAYLDIALELLLLSGKKLPEALMILIPEAWQKNQAMDPQLRAFYEYHAPLMEPWDGPAAVITTDGYRAAITLDRNGLRPCRYAVTKQGLFVAASEAGAVPFAWEDVIKHGRLGPGELLVIDPSQGGILENKATKSHIAHLYDYQSWVDHHVHNMGRLEILPDQDLKKLSWDLTQLQIAAGITLEELNMVLGPMALGADEPTSSMGDDTPLAVLSNEPRLLFDFFKQQFAQVTNPPIDPLREDLVMSLQGYLGRKGSVMLPPVATDLLRLDHPILNDAQLKYILEQTSPNLSSFRLSTLVPVATGLDGFSVILDNLTQEAAESVRKGTAVLVLSDRGISAEYAALPSLLAVSAVHHKLISLGIRSHVDIVIETAEARTVHHMACLVGFGAQAIHPYMALDSIGQLIHQGDIGGDLTPSEGQANYLKALAKGLLKVLSKMGIATLRSYNGAKVFEGIGLDRDFTERYFQGTTTLLSGFDLTHIAKATLARHTNAFDKKLQTGALRLPSGGNIHYRQSSERHAWHPDSITLLQHAAKSGSRETYDQFKELANGAMTSPHYIRHLLALQDGGTTALPEVLVEEARLIVQHFTTGAMSLGAISREAHETLALAMNSLGGKSNTGEGGEDAEREKPLPDGSTKLSAIRQIASARFGVTLEYLTQGRELQIKIAQGAKPGEGGQLPGHKVDKEIARLRHSTPGVALISPPPHHDIYSIEDLAQLIHDLKEANPRAKVSVKLVSASGIGAVAAGVAKAGADKIVVSCGSGGTGASPLSSIKHAGLPWELGLAETHQTLVINGLRPWVKLEVDGQLKTGRDVVIGALLGADEFGFATAPLIATGCIMMRKCHLNTCPVGIATQDPELRAKFQGKPEHVINYLFLVAEDVRSLLAQLGLRSLAEARGRTDLLKEQEELTKPRGLDLRPLLYCPKPPSIKDLLPQRPISSTSFSQSLEEGLITTAQRTFGTRLSYERSIQERSGASLDPLSLTIKGYAGQSLGAFLTRGVTLTLQGIANDYVGKGLSGGRIIVVPPVLAGWDEEPPAAVGNTVLYGATSGELFIAGTAGERFAVRNSGATAVVEGTGHHGCEYMTGGVIVVLGKTGRNFGAGMSGGYAYVWDEDETFSLRVNHEMVELDCLSDLSHNAEIQHLKRLISTHAQLTQSPRAKALLEQWPEVLNRFIKVTPKEYKAVLLATRGLAEKPSSALAVAMPAIASIGSLSHTVDSSLV